MDKKQAEEEDKENQVGADEMLILNLVHQVALVRVKVAVEDKGGIDRRYIMSPPPGEHACRLRNPGGFQKGRFRRTSRRSGGKIYHIIMGRLKGQTTMTEQSYRYPRTSWTASQARSHCSEHDGRFEAAGGGKQ